MKQKQIKEMMTQCSCASGLAPFGIKNILGKTGATQMGVCALDGRNIAMSIS